MIIIIYSIYNMYNIYRYAINAKAMLKKMLKFSFKDYF